MRHYLINSKEQIVKEFPAFDKEAIKASIIEYLKANPNDELTHEKECKDSRYVGNDILKFYGVDPKTGAVSVIIQRAGRIGYRAMA